MYIKKSAFSILTYILSVTSYQFECIFAKLWLIFISEKYFNIYNYLLLTMYLFIIVFQVFCHVIIIYSIILIYICLLKRNSLFTCVVLYEGKDLTQIYFFSSVVLYNSMKVILSHIRWYIFDFIYRAHAFLKPRCSVLWLFFFHTITKLHRYFHIWKLTLNTVRFFDFLDVHLYTQFNTWAREIKPCANCISNQVKISTKSTLWLNKNFIIILCAIESLT